MPIWRILVEDPFQKICRLQRQGKLGLVFDFFILNHYRWFLMIRSLTCFNPIDTVQLRAWIYNPKNIYGKTSEIQSNKVSPQLITNIIWQTSTHFQYFKGTLFSALQRYFPTHFPFLLRMKHKHTAGDVVSVSDECWTRTHHRHNKNHISRTVQCVQ